MRILHVTAGAANMYCGSCLRDNALAAELKRQGHDVVLMPVYTPTLTDTPNVSEKRVFFGGISVYLQQNSALFRHTPEFLDRLLFDNTWALRKASRRSIGVDPKFLGEMTVSMLKGEHGPIAKEFRKLARWLRQEPKFDIINLPFALLLGMAAPMKAAGRSRMVCTLQGEDLFLEGLQEPYRSESLRLIRKGAESVDRFIAVSRYYAGFMAGYLGIPEEKIAVAPIGVPLDGLTPKPKPVRDHVRIGYFARIDPAKGFHHLCEAYILLRAEGGLPAPRLEAAGYLLPGHARYFEEVRAKITAAGLGGEFTYHGTLSREAKIAFLQDVDFLCVPTDYAEPKGLFALEAMACGTPVVLPAHGAFPEILSQTGGGVLYKPKDTAALTRALRDMITCPERRAILGQKGAENVPKLYSAEAMAAAHMAAYA
jgi:glycosyltransferase involved in cell wall biosynthesis